MTIIENITTPNQTPVDGDLIRVIDGNTVIEKLYYAVVAPTDEEIAQEARDWRNAELSRTDWISQTPDHPQRAAYLTYRTALRDWPSTSNFPATKPELGS
jgi:hypothetical protein